MAISDPVAFQANLTRAVSLALANSMERHGHTCESLAAWITERGDEVSASVVKRWRNTASSRCIGANRMAQLPPAILRDMLVWFADLQNSVIVERVLEHEHAETDEELALDAVCAVNGLVTWLRTREGDANKVCDQVVCSAERARMGLNRRPSVRKSRPPARVREMEVA